MNVNSEILIDRYLDAKDYVINAGYSGELDWQAERSFSRLNESEFLQEIAWVILSSGFKESVVRKVFPSVSASFFYWEKASMITLQLDNCKKNALEVFGNKRKIEAIGHAVEKVSRDGFTNVKRLTQVDKLDYLTKFPYVGPVTGLHLLKNIGISVAKPDRHLVRIAESTGFDSVENLCSEIERYVGDNVAEIDLVLWRYATLRSDYISFFCCH